jgi:hypothetical protein
MRYPESASHQLDNTRLVGLLGSESHTKLDEAVRTSLGAMNRLAVYRHRGEENAEGQGELNRGLSRGRWQAARQAL